MGVKAKVLVPIDTPELADVDNVSQKAFVRIAGIGSPVRKIQDHIRKCVAQRLIPKRPYPLQAARTRVFRQVTRRIAWPPPAVIRPSADQGDASEVLRAIEGTGQVKVA